MSISKSPERELLALQDELLHRQKDDAMRSWKPHPKQKPFIDAIVKGESRRVAAFFANRAGKSQAGAYAGAHLARFGPAKPNSIYQGSGKEFIEVRDRATSGWVVSLDFKNSRDVIAPKYFDNGFVPPGGDKPFIPEREIKEWRQSDQVLKLKNGSLIGFMSADSEVTKFQGAGKDWIHFDEEPPKPHFEEAIMRVEAGRSLTVFMTCTLLPPVGELGGVSWAYNDIVKPWKAGELKDWKIFTASIYDNPHIGRDEIALLESLWAPGTTARRIRLEGELLPGISGMRAYSNFSHDLHVKPQGELDERRPLCWCWDFNVAPMITEIAQREGDTFRFFDEICLEEGSIADMVDAFMMRYRQWHGQVWIYGDATGQNRDKQTSLTDFTAIFNALRPYNISYRKKIPHQNPGQIERLNSVQNALLDEESMIHVEVDPKCKELIDDFEQVLMDPAGGIKKSRKPRDPYYRRTHSCLRGDTPVLTTQGYRPIKDIKPGDSVKTPAGDARVTHAGPVSRVNKMIRITMENGAEIWATPEHKFFTERGLITADALRYLDVLLPTGHPICATAASSLTQKNTTLGLRTAVTTLVESEKTEKTRLRTSIGRFGSFITDPSRRIAASIIKITTGWITESRISNFSKSPITPNIMATALNGLGQKQISHNFLKPRIWPRFGTKARKAGSGTANTREKLPKEGSGTQKNVSSADRNTGLRTQNARSTATRIVKLQICAVKEELTYDLSVERHQCYMANGVLVSNSDAAGYFICYERPLRRSTIRDKVKYAIKDAKYAFR